MNTRISKEEAQKALEEAFNNEDKDAMLFWSGYVLALS